MKLQHDFIRNYLSGEKKSYVFLPIVKEMGDFCSVVFSNYIWICIWICAIEISLGEKNIWNRCWLQLYCCNLWNQLNTPDLVSLRIYNIFYMVIRKTESNNLTSWSFSVLFSMQYTWTHKWYLISVKENTLQINRSRSMHLQKK